MSGFGAVYDYEMHFLSLVSILVALVGCGASPENGGPPAFQDDTGKPNELHTGQLMQSVRAGTPAGGVGAVEILVYENEVESGFCTGYLVGTQMLLTVSHCFDKVLGDATVGDAWVKISYAVTGTTWRCITRVTPTDGKCNTWGPVTVRRFGPSDGPAYDLAAVFHRDETNFYNVSASETSSGIFEGPPTSSEPYQLYGAGLYHYDGTGAGVMRYMSDNLDWVGAEHFVTDASYVRVCRGDSGAPYYLSGTRWAFGVHSSAELSSHCAKVGGKARGMRFTPLKVSLINLWRAVEGRALCTQHSSQWPKFWVCP